MTQITGEAGMEEIELGHVIVFTSGKGGTGKTTAAAAVGSCLAALGCRTLCIDMDRTLRNLDLALGMHDAGILDSGDVAAGRCTLAEAATLHPDIPELYLLNCPAEADDMAWQQTATLLSKARDAYDYCLIDSPAGLGDGFRMAAAHADSAMLLVTSDSTSRRDAQKTMMELDRLGVTRVHLIVNRLRPGILRRGAHTVDDIIDFVGAPLIGLVPEDKGVLLAAAAAKPLVLYGGGRAAKAFLRIAKRLKGDSVPLQL